MLAERAKLAAPSAMMGGVVHALHAFRRATIEVCNFASSETSSPTAASDALRAGGSLAAASAAIFALGTMSMSPSSTKKRRGTPPPTPSSKRARRTSSGIDDRTVTAARNDHDHDNDEQNDEESILEDDDAYARTVSSAWHRASRCALVAREMSATSPDSVRGFRHVIASLLGGRSLEVEDALAVVSDATESDALSLAAALAVTGVARGEASTDADAAALVRDILDTTQTSGDHGMASKLTRCIHLARAAAGRARAARDIWDCCSG